MKEKLCVVISATNHYNERAKYVIEENKDAYEVLYVTSDFAHIPKKKFVCDVENSVQLHVIPYYKNLSVSRILSHCMFSCKALFLLMKRKPEKVYVEIPNNTLAFTTSIYKKMSGCELIFDIFDMWPEALPIKSNNALFKMACAVWRWFRNVSLKNADKIYAECEYFKDIIAKQGHNYPIQIQYLKKADTNLPYETIWDENEINICYVGSINNIIDIPLMVEFLTKLSDKRKVRFHVVGTGEGKERLCDQLRSNENIALEEYGVVYDVNELQKIFNKCLFGINFLLPDLAIGITMKSVTYLQGALPLLNTVDGDTTKFVTEKNVGINVNRDKIEETIDAVLELSQSDICKMKDNAKDLFKQVFVQ